MKAANVIPWLLARRWIVLSLVASAICIAYTKSDLGDILHEFTDHLHHSRITWTFLNVGIDAYRRPFGETGNAVPFPHFGVTWDKFPLAYPPGMLVVFLPLALIGRFVPMALITFSKINVGYLTFLMHAALGAMIPLVREVRSRLFVGFFVMLWVFAVRASLLGFYDGAWLLCGVYGVRALANRDAARSMLWFVASALISYRSAALAPFMLIAFLALWRGDAPVARKVGLTLLSIVSAGVVAWCFTAVIRYGPKGPDAMAGVGSSLLPMSFRPYTLLFFGLGVAIYMVLRTDLLVGLCVALCSGLAIIHGGHTWHGMILFSPFLALSVSSRKPFNAQVLMLLWAAFTLSVAFDYQPFRFVEELIHFFETNGDYHKPGFCI